MATEPDREQLQALVDMSAAVYQDLYERQVPFGPVDSDLVMKALNEYRKNLKKLRKHDKAEAAKYGPVFITWKKYGFRHISAYEGGPIAPTRHDYPYSMVKGVAFCGHDYDFYLRDQSHDEAWWLTNVGDPRSMDRPLCGTCRNYWRSLTGEEL